MMINSPYTEILASFKRTQIVKQFPDLQNHSCNAYVSLYKYISHIPECFYDEKVFSLFFDWLKLCENSYEEKLKKYFSCETDRISNAIRCLNQINDLKIHDDMISGRDDYDLLENIDKYIHPNYLKLVEAVFAPLVRPIAYFSRIKRNAKTDGLDVFNMIEEIKTQLPNMQKVIQAYQHIMRNGIAHGGIEYLSHEIKYTDKKGESESFYYSDVIKIFDEMLDACNALVLALELFFIQNYGKGFDFPFAFSVEELIAQAKNKWVEINNCISMTIQADKTQLLIFAFVRTTDIQKVNFCMLQIATLAEFLMPHFNRYFISIKSNCAFPGWYGFRGEKLYAARLSKGSDYSIYNNVVDDSGIFFKPKIKFPKLFYRFDSFKESFAIHWNILKPKLREIFMINYTSVLSSEIHRNKWSVVINADVVLDFAIESDIMNYIRNNYKKIMSSVVREVRKRERFFSLCRILPVGFSRISVFEKRRRKRTLIGYGLGENLVCTIQLKKLKRIRCPDIFGSVIEQYDLYRIAWNKNWLEKNVLVKEKL